MSGAAGEAEDKRMKGETRTWDEDKGHGTSYKVRTRTGTQYEHKNEMRRGQWVGYRGCGAWLTLSRIFERERERESEHCEELLRVGKMGTSEATHRYNSDLSKSSAVRKAQESFKREWKTVLLKVASAVGYERERERRDEGRVKTECGETQDGGGTLLRCVSDTSLRRVRMN